jgi:hypothetical protein
MTGVPEIVAPAFIADVVVTGIALAHTYDDYQQGEISGVTALALAGTGAAGLFPGEVGFGFSVVNTIITVFGFPYP